MACTVIPTEIPTNTDQCIPSNTDTEIPTIPTEGGGYDTDIGKVVGINMVCTSNNIIHSWIIRR